MAYPCRKPRIPSVIRASGHLIERLDDAYLFASVPEHEPGPLVLHPA